MSSPHPSQIAVLVDILRQRSDCIVHPSRGLPELAEGHVLSHDLREFYSLCGGASLHDDADHPCALRAPESFKQANGVVLSELSTQDQRAHLPADYFSWVGTPSLSSVRPPN